MKSATVESRCECEAKLVGRARRGASRVARLGEGLPWARAARPGDRPCTYRIACVSTSGFMCPFCTRNVLRSFEAEAAFLPLAAALFLTLLDEPHGRRARRRRRVRARRSTSCAAARCENTSPDIGRVDVIEHGERARSPPPSRRPARAGATSVGGAEGTERRGMATASGSVAWPVSRRLRLKRRLEPRERLRRLTPAMGRRDGTARGRCPGIDAHGVGLRRCAGATRDARTGVSERRRSGSSGGKSRSSDGPAPTSSNRSRRSRRTLRPHRATRPRHRHEIGNDRGGQWRARDHFGFTERLAQRLPERAGVARPLARIDGERASEHGLHRVRHDGMPCVRGVGRRERSSTCFMMRW